MIFTQASLEKLVRRLAAKKGLVPKETEINSSNFSRFIPLILEDITKDQMEQGQVVPMEDLLDANIDDLQDLPEFEVPPQGHYKLLVSLERKTINEKPSIEAKLVVKEVLELAKSTDKTPEVGMKFSQLFMMDNEYGQGGFKEFVKPIGATLGISKVGELISKVQNVEIAATVKHRVHKDDKNKPKEEQRVFANLSNVAIA